MTRDLRKIKRLLTFLKPYWPLELAALGVMIVIAALALALPIAVRYMIDVLIPKMAQSSAKSVNLTPVLIFGSALLGVYLFHVIFTLSRDYLAAKIGANIVRDIRARLFFHLNRVSLRFFQKNQIGEIMSRLLSDVNHLQSLLTTTILTICTDIFLLAAIFIYLASINWLLTLVAVVPVPLTIYLSNRFGLRLHKLSHLLQETIARLSGRLQESFSATKTIRAFGQERTSQRKVDSVLNSLTGQYVNISVTTSLAYNLVHFINMIGPVVVLAWGTFLIAGGSIKLGALMSFFLLLTYLYEPIKDLASLNIDVSAAMASVDRILAYLDLPTAVDEDPYPVVLKNVKGGIHFDNVTFAYEKGFILSDINLAVSPGEKVALVGPSGSGKTTLTNLLMRFFDPDSGSISLDGTDLKKVSLVGLRRNIGLVEQEPLLFQGTVWENITFADPSATREDAVRAAKIANIHDFIEALPEGYESFIGERGVTVSGGERQRLCLARAILHQPPVLILDEATSALDSRGEQLIQQALNAALKGKTAIIIAHRLSSIRHADRIIVMDNGCIVDHGTHEGLLSHSPLYRELATNQLA
jgi:subfamily B ATP-binding cassette protein MsbA